MSVYVQVITSPNCPHSPRAIELLQRMLGKKKNIVLEEVSMITEHGREMAEEYSIGSTPAITIDGVLTFEGMPTKKQLLEVISDAEYQEKERKSSYF